MNPKRIIVALIGYGYWGSKLYRYLKENQNFHLKYVFALSKKNLPEFTNNPRDIWQDEEIAAVAVATPIETHHAVVKEALLAKKHVFSAKPLATKTSQCLKLKKLAEKQKLVLAVDYTWTFSQALKKAQKIDIGPLKAVEAEIKQLGRFRKGDVHWLLTSHLLSILDLFISLKTLSFKKIDLLKNRGLTETSAIFFENKKIKGIINVSLNCPEKSVKLILYGAKGTITFQPRIPETLKASWYQKTGKDLAKELITKTKTYRYDEANNLKYAVEYFHQILTGKAKTNLNQAIKITEIIQNL